MSESTRREVIVHKPEPADALTWQVGDVTVARCLESVTEMSPRYLLPDLTRELVASLDDWTAPFFTPDAMMLLSVHSFVVQSGDNTVVVDTCIADHSDHALPGDAEFVDRLAAAIPGGLEAVDYVVCTHMHFDHVGWNTRLVDGEWVPTFPNARYLVSKDELAGTQADDAMGVMEPSITPLIERGMLDTVESDHRIDENLCLVPSAGHSPGHVCVSITSGGQQALITGDAFHSPAQFAHPEVSATYADTDSTQATATRHRLLEQLTDTDTVVFGTHFARPTAGRVRSGPDRAWFDTEI